MKKKNNRTQRMDNSKDERVLPQLSDFVTEEGESQDNTDSKQETNIKSSVSRENRHT